MTDRLSQQSDRELIAEFKSGSVEAYDTLIRRYQTRIYNMAIRVTRDQHDAEEVVQDVFVTLFKKIDQFEERCAFSSWVYRISMNTALMLIRRRKYRMATSLDEISGTGVEQLFSENTTRRDYIAAEIRNEIEQALARLPETYRKVFIIRELNGLTNEQASEELKISVPAVKSKLHRARNKLRKSLKRYWEEYQEDLEPSSIALAA